MRMVHNLGSDSSGMSTAPSKATSNSKPELDFPSPQSSKNPRENQRTRDQILREISEPEREFARRDQELREARQKKVDVMVRLESLRTEFKDSQSPPDPFTFTVSEINLSSLLQPLPPLVKPPIQKH